MGSKGIVADCCETSQIVNITIKKPTPRYINEFIGLKCAPDLLLANIYPDAKEITESMGAYNAVRSCLRRDFPLNDPSTTMLAVADGSTPRTGALFAFRSKWGCISVDPNMQDKPGSLERWKKISRLHTHRLTIQDFLENQDMCYSPKLVIAAVHSHVSLQDICEAVRSHPNVAIIAMPCCIDLSLQAKPVAEYEDWSIWSPERTVRIYCGFIHRGKFYNQQYPLIPRLQKDAEPEEYYSD